MPLTYSGRLVRPGGSEHPSIIDIGVALSRQPRFAGHGKRWWSVLDHTLFCDELVQRDITSATWGNIGSVRLALLLHDAHEAITGDVPTDVKPPELRDTQKRLDELIFEAYFPGGYEDYIGSWGYVPAVKHFDRRALVAEAHIVGPQATPDRLLDLFGCTDTMADDKALLDRFVDYTSRFFGIPPMVQPQENHPAVKEFVSRMTALL